jgi:hypothetical protein
MRRVMMSMEASMMPILEKLDSLRMVVMSLLRRGKRRRRKRRRSQQSMKTLA